MFDHYPNRVLGLLMADDGRQSNQWIFDRQTPEQTRRRMADQLPVVKGATELDVFLRVVRNVPTGELPTERLFDKLGRSATTWVFPSNS